MMINLDKHICKAKRKDNRRWVKGYYVALRDTTYCFKEDYDTHPDNTKHYIVVDKMTDWGLPNEHYWVEVDPETVCQCTGLSDKNGTIIFENDCIGHKLNVVEYFDGSFCVNGDTPLCYMNKYYQVVGNKFDYGVLNNG